MSRRTVTGILIAIAGVIVAGIGFFAIRQILNQSLTPPVLPTPIPSITEKVVVMNRDAEVGDLLEAEDLVEVDMPVELIPRNAISSLQNVAGKITKVQLVDGEIVLSHHLADPTNVSHDLAFVIDDDKVLMAFPASDLMSGLNVLQRGDFVDIFVSIEEEVAPEEADETGAPANEEEEATISRLFTFDAMQAVDITAMVVDVTYEEGQSPVPAVGEEGPRPTPQPVDVNVRAYLLALDPQDALVLKHLKDLGGRFDIVLRASNSIIRFDLQPVISEYLIDKYELEITR
ncbi:MAG: hypothetical protein GWN30_21930 [Gammaproteobacteria bacterium]|nr:hypothetical protein [Gammaproteobacteria bacterium]